MDRFNGVATKYLNNYMYWFKWIELFKTDKDGMKCKRLFIQSHAFYSNTQLKDFKNRTIVCIGFICYIIRNCYIIRSNFI